MLLYGKNRPYDGLYPGVSDGTTLYEMIALAERYHLSGNLRQAYLAWLIMTDENPFSLSLERNPSGGSVEQFAKSDIEELYNLFFAVNEQPALNDYQPAGNTASDEELRKGRMIMDFAEKLRVAWNSDAFFAAVKDFYIAYGVGLFGLNKAFYMRDDGQLVPVSHLRQITLDDIWGYDRQKEQLIANTRAFAEGSTANNVLLYGDSGTGKSTSVKAVLNMFYDKGLRMIQIQKHQFAQLGALTESLKKRNYRFVLYMDDLSFEDFEVEYKYLKAAIEGGLEEKPENMLIYATSNRRHLIKETFAEREGGGDIHRNESIQEKISLSDRFGVTVYYPKPVQQEFFDMVEYLAEKEGLSVDRDDLIAKARKWGVAHGGFSGRTAAQFILFIKNEEAL